MGASTPDYEFVHKEVLDLASTFLPRNRLMQARTVDLMLVERQRTIDQLRERDLKQSAKIERYQEENALLRAYIGQIRASTVEAAQVIEHALAAPIPEPRKRT